MKPAPLLRSLALFALLLGLAVERLLTHLFHLREFRWLDPVFNACLLEFKQRLWIVFVHIYILHIVATGVNRITQLLFIII